jgi:translation initiation factor 4G
VREKELCSAAVFDFEEVFNGLAEALDDLAVDIPKVWPYFAMLLRGSGLNQDEERSGQIAENLINSIDCCSVGLLASFSPSVLCH